ncbi:MAG: rhomboid family intramembrane serine protease [Gemmatimonadales bacterium]|nr:rhomboid family intramembrane serine protease [Gemmatimonadales bacterium]NIN10793.1 rhomboid family intramembrane serine protease [Gemmatimonadales bacterium]NIN48939.1 rhomboid family intramembrane serine protease [Gemmatimonadales bacterium]NIP06403.1 rhomboid family intramembrane serine protease [Gemmatimonadales bacterium]NIR00214.1 rhomboid family intramembrane serine protease [Gemmatimonadales bacterium]
MFPYKDENPTILTPVVTVGVIVVTGLVWVLVQGAGSQPALARSVCELGLIPGELLGRVPEGTLIPIAPRLGCEIGGDGAWHTVLSSMFLHGGWLHFIGNMWFLWIFGNNVEDSMGHGRFVVFYLLCGVLAAAAQIVVQPSSPVPMVGASGAISGVMGAYLVLYPRVRVHMLVFLGFFVTTIAVPAYFMLLYWAFLQLLGSLPTIGGGGAEGGVAFMAHLGGFVAGAALIKAFAKPELIQAHRRRRVVFRDFSGDRWGY